LNQKVKAWCSEINIHGNFGSHTLRKTWGFHQRVTYNVGIPVLMDVYGHATQRQTLTYLCIQDEEVRDTYLNEL
jgi:hypothetical protein